MVGHSIARRLLAKTTGGMAKRSHESSDFLSLITLTIASLTRDADPLRPLPHALLVCIIRDAVIVGFVD